MIIHSTSFWSRCFSRSPRSCLSIFSYTFYRETEYSPATLRCSGNRGFLHNHRIYAFYSLTVFSGLAMLDCSVPQMVQRKAPLLIAFITRLWLPYKASWYSDVQSGFLHLKIIISHLSCMYFRVCNRFSVQDDRNRYIRLS